uniref:Uncharacterized protein n=1 Tax=Triticum urartu TaxID=4572 RepID=A0A8R7PSH4_TRIUA
MFKPSSVYIHNWIMKMSKQNSVGSVWFHCLVGQ